MVPPVAWRVNISFPVSPNTKLCGRPHSVHIFFHLLPNPSSVFHASEVNRLTTFLLRLSSARDIWVHRIDNVKLGRIDNVKLGYALCSVFSLTEEGKG